MKIALEKLTFWIRVTLIVFTIIVIAGVLTRTIGDLRSYPGIDLRAKVVGARLLIRGMDPYYDSRYEVHPDHLRMLAEDTYSPALLILYAPLCEASWNTQRVIYFCIDWISILSCFLVLSRAFPSGVYRVSLWFAFVLMFIAGLSFRLHLERGQYYIELTLLVCLAAACLLREHDSWLGTLPLALLVLFRPPYAICILGLIVLRRFRLAAVAGSLCVLLFALTLPLAGIGDWRDYFREIHSNQLEMASQAYAGSQPSGTQNQLVEGIDFSRSLTYPGYLADRTLTGVARSSVSSPLARLIHWIAPSESGFDRLNFTALGLACLFDLALIYGFARRRIDGLVSIAFLFLAPLNLECFAPQRFAYCDVTILAPALLLLAALLRSSRRIGWALYGTVLALNVLLPLLAVCFNKHAPLASFLGYTGVLAVLNFICILQVWGAQLAPITGLASDGKPIDDCAVA